jgi:phenylpyruvate tautomerase PptA (4-oxalocrotonate tautomerase family)
MPIITVECSEVLVRSRGESLRALLDVAERELKVESPTQVRMRLVAVDSESMAVGRPADDGPPWAVVWVNVLPGRPESVVTAFMSAFADAVAQAYGIDVKHVRVLVQEYPKTFWGIGSQSAAALR